MKIAISSESPIDLTKELKEKFDIKVLSYSITLGEKVALDGEITPKEIFEYVQKNNILPKTSAINDFQYAEHFENLLKEYDAIIHISLSSEISSSFANVSRVASEFKNVYVIDSKSLSTGIALLSIYAKKLADEGHNPQEIYELVQKRVPYVQASFVLKKLNYLYKGGRCSALKLFGANLLQIRPQIILKNGKMEPHKKFRGEFTSCVKKYIEETLNEFNNPDLENAFITYTTASDEAVEYAKQALKERGFKNIYQTTAGSTITSHCGEDTLGILYINDANIQN